MGEGACCRLCRNVKNMLYVDPNADLHITVMPVVAGVADSARNVGVSENVALQFGGDIADDILELNLNMKLGGQETWNLNKAKYNGADANMELGLAFDWHAITDHLTISTEGGMTKNYLGTLDNRKYGLFGDLSIEGGQVFKLGERSAIVASLKASAGGLYAIEEPNNSGHKSDGIFYSSAAFDIKFLYTLSQYSVLFAGASSGATYFNPQKCDDSLSGLTTAYIGGLFGKID